MDKHWKNYCTLSIVHFMAFPECIAGEGPVYETILKIAEDPFFDAIEIGWIKDPSVRVAVKYVLDVSHMKVAYGAQPSLLLHDLNLNSLVEDQRELAVQQLKEDVDEAAEMGAQRMAFLSGKDPGDQDRDAALDALTESVIELCAYARQRNISLTCEVFDRDVDKKCLIGPSDFAAQFAKEIRQEFPDFGLMYDLSHMPLLQEEAQSALSTITDALVHVHVGNCVTDPDLLGYGDLHPRFGWPGGSNDVDELAEFLQALFETGYLSENHDELPWIGFEVKPQSDQETSELIIAGSKRTWQEAWAKL